MFLENSVHRNNEPWKYIIGSVLVIIASFVGQIPLTVAITLTAIKDGKAFPTNQAELMRVLDTNLTLFLLLLSFAVALLALYLVVRNFHKTTFLSIVTSRKKLDIKRVFFAFITWSVFTIVMTIIQYFLEPQDYVLNFKPIPFLILFLIGFVFIPIQTTTEELVFRGYLMQGFANLSKNKWFPLMMTSLIFGGMHILNPEVEKLGYITMVYYIGTGVFLGIITLMDEGTELALGFHAANNLITALLVTTDWTAFQTESVLKDISEPSTGWEVLVPVLIIFPILLFIFSKKYHWNNWNQKLTGKIDTLSQNINSKQETDDSNV